MIMLSVHDSATDSYINPITVPSLRDGISQFEMVVNDPTTNYHKFPADFTLVEVGSFNQDTGQIIALAKPKILKNAAALIKPTERAGSRETDKINEHFGVKTNEI